jgi:transcriptional regulator with XRE-family HTH domain
MLSDFVAKRLNGLERSEQLRLYREYLGLTQAQLAGEMGATQTSIARWESGAAPIRSMTMILVQKLVAIRVMEETQLLMQAIPGMFARRNHSSTVGDFELLFSTPDALLRFDNQERAYLGLVFLRGNRTHTLQMRVRDRMWHAVDKHGQATWLDGRFLIPLVGTGRRPDQIGHMELLVD